jgi:hypothetical protein
LVTECDEGRKLVHDLTEETVELNGKLGYLELRNVDLARQLFRANQRADHFEVLWSSLKTELLSSFGNQLLHPGLLLSYMQAREELDLAERKLEDGGD